MYGRGKMITVVGIIKLSTYLQKLSYIPKLHDIISLFSVYEMINIHMF